MKTFRKLSFAMIIALAFASCGSEKQIIYVQQPAQQQAQQTTPQQSQPAQQPVQKTNEQLGTPEYKKGEQILEMPCMDEGLDNPGEYMAGYGVVEGRPDRTSAVISANEAAIQELSTKFVGVIKNATNWYNKDTNIPSGKKIYESKLEGGAEAIAKKVLNKYANAVCRKVAFNEYEGNYIGYVAVHIPVKDAVDETMRELEEQYKVDYDHMKFKEYMNNAIEEEYQNK